MNSERHHVETVQRLFVKHVSALRVLIRAFVPDFNQADDVLQDTFLLITEKADSFQEGTNFLAWAAAIARLKVLESCRKGRMAGQTLSPEVIDTLFASLPTTSPQDDFPETLRECIDELAPSARRAIDLRYGESCKPAEIARRLKWKPEAVYVALSRARSLLRDCIDRKLKKQELR